MSNKTNLTLYPDQSETLTGYPLCDDTGDLQAVTASVEVGELLAGAREIREALRDAVNVIDAFIDKAKENVVPIVTVSIFRRRDELRALLAKHTPKVTK